MLTTRNHGAGRLEWLERRFDLLAEQVRFDVVDAPSLAPVLDQIRDGKDIKAAQVYTQVFSCTLSEAMFAVNDLRERLERA